MINFICIFLNERRKDKPKDYLRLHDYSLILLLHDPFYMTSGKAKDIRMKKRSMLARGLGEVKLGVMKVFCN